MAPPPGPSSCGWTAPSQPSARKFKSPTTPPTRPTSQRLEATRTLPWEWSTWWGRCSHWPSWWARLSERCSCTEGAARPNVGALCGEAPRDDKPLNLIRAFEDLGDLGLPHVALDAEVAGVADAAQHLDRIGGDLHRGVGGHQLGHAGLL